ncbi:hypothetical protein [Rossellomorea sp. NS-SX7]|uniref:hypothetical protein n=1 Tax=Rossellomorea sp. NS-SX7 TaxID=3463856 RepID=UPI00405A3FF1
MKKITLFTFVLIGGMLLGGCGASDNAEEVKEVTPAEDSQPAAGDGKKEKESSNVEENQNLSSGIEKTISSVEDLAITLKSGADDATKLNEQGMMIEEKWDEIEKEIEEKYPEDYKNIEESLYPLIEESKKETPDSANLKTLADDTNNKLNEFHEKIKNE